jgi:hypothetical protein
MAITNQVEAIKIDGGKHPIAVKDIAMMYFNNGRFYIDSYNEPTIEVTLQSYRAIYPYYYKMKAGKFKL